MLGDAICYVTVPKVTVSYFTLCYVVLCYVVCVMICNVLLCYITLRYVMLRYIMLCHKGYVLLIPGNDVFTSCETSFLQMLFQGKMLQ